jgi:putative phosphoribosyl transferase
MEFARGLFAMPLYEDRRDAGRTLAELMPRERLAGGVVVGLARGGIVVAAEIATALELPLDALAVRKVGHPWQPEYAIGAVAPGGGVFVRGSDGLTAEQVAEAVADAERRAGELDKELHAVSSAISVAGIPCLLVDDGLATGATMVAAARWARGSAASLVVAAVPVAASPSIALVAREVDEVVCPHALDDFYAVGVWYADFEQVEDETVMRLLADSRRSVTLSS